LRNLKFENLKIDLKKYLPYTVLIILFVWHSVLFAQQRFPRPEFESGYVYPTHQLPDQRGPLWEYMDVAILFIALGVTTWLALKKRSRQGLIWMSVFSLAYFGFYRQGCICSVGSVQNLSLALFNSDYAMPLSALLFFIVPLVFALLFGRVFCSGVCPLGAIQELTGFRPVKIHKSVESILSAIPFIYLGLAILFSATGSQFIICRYDPFVGIFRLDAPYTMIIFGSLLLLSGIFVNRPYCRYLCPYGVLQNIFSQFSGKHLTITPAECTNCRLCEESCPYDAILPSDTGVKKEIKEISRKRFLTYFLLIPVMAAAGALILGNLALPLSRINSTVRLADEIRYLKENGGSQISVALNAFEESGKTEEQLFDEEQIVLEKFRKGAPWVGIFLGLSLGIGLFSQTIRKPRTEYKPHQGRCFSCGKCFEYCPVVKKI
jgi:NosR/NirI family transcriptional regulator, nitrous oxide reductase regulator